MTDERHGRPFDPGLQPERTALAWRRTALALLVAALAAVRVLPDLLGVWSIIPAGIGVLMAVYVLVASQRRYRQHHIRLVTADHDQVELPDGKLPALVALLTTFGAVACVTVVISIAIHR